MTEDTLVTVFSSASVSVVLSQEEHVMNPYSKSQSMLSFLFLAQRKPVSC